MTDLKSPVSRRTIGEHPRHKRRMVATLTPGDTISFRLERGQQSYALSIEQLFNYAESLHAKALSNTNT